MVVHRHEHLVLLHERHEPPRFREHRGRAEPFGAELARRFERPIALGVGEGLVEVDVVEVNPQPRVLESPPDVPVVRHRHGEPPLSRLLAQPREVRRTAALHPPAGHHAGKRLDVAGHDLALGDAECLQVLDDGRDELRVAGRRQIVEAEGLDAEHHAVDGRHRGRALRSEEQRTASQRLEKITAIRNHEGAPRLPERTAPIGTLTCQSTITPGAPCAHAWSRTHVSRADSLSSMADLPLAAAGPRLDQLRS